MAKNLNQEMNVTLKFGADTNEAKSKMKELQQTLTNLINNSAARSKLGLTTEVNEAISSANKLKVALEQATDTKTGQLNLAKLSKSIDAKDLSKYAQQMASLGPQGQQAFSQIAKAITTASVPLKQSSALLEQFRTTLANTIKWQLSSSLIHGVMGAIQGAYGYAQDLNESLNNIRIVTGQSTEQMAAFAQQANKAAQSLSATTLDYTNASLIYYQQGLSDEEVRARTDVTIKMANVSRQSAEEVSNQMTAIWNNFAEGSKNLEYYADVITALGAATASSSEEISTGLEKFAAVSKTVGLSYEYATAALATITATTRQSADTVGTGLRTIFSRLESLKLGETLEDGVDLNKYSKAMQTVGVDILDATGNLKQMDTILDETAAKWQNLNQAQKMAFASTVGGVRQYTTLIALMDNWDFMQKNLQTAQDSGGTVNKQQQIYAESWEAARDRVTAALQDIYQKLLDDKGFITILNSLEKIIKGFSTFIDIIGGLPSMIFLIGSIFTKVYQKDIATFFDNISYNIQSKMGKVQETLFEYRQAAYKAVDQMIPNADSNFGAIATKESYHYEIDAQSTYIAKQQELLKNKQEMNDLDKAAIENSLSILNIQTERVREQAELVDKKEEEMAQLELELKIRAKAAVDRANELSASPQQRDEQGHFLPKEVTKEQAKKTKATTDEFQRQKLQLDDLAKSYGIALKAMIELQKAQKNLKNSTDNSAEATKRATEDMKKYIAELQERTTVKIINDDELNSIQNYDELIKLITEKAEQFGAKTANMTEQVQNLSNQFMEGKFNAEEYANKIIALAQSQGELVLRQQQAAQATEFLKKQISEISASTPTTSQALTQMSSSAMTYMMALTQISNLSDVWTSESTAIQKLTTTFMALGTSVRAIMGLQKGMNALREASNSKQLLSIIQNWEESKSEEDIANKILFKDLAENKNYTTKQKLAIAQAIATKTINANTTAEQANTVAIKANTKATWSNPWLAAAAILLMIAVAAVSAATKAIEKKTEAINKDSERAVENLSTVKEQIDANEKLLSSYEDLYLQYIKTNKITNELRDSALAVAEAYNIQNGALLVAQGRYEELARAANNARIQELDRARKTAGTTQHFQEVKLENDLGSNANISSGSTLQRIVASIAASPSGPPEAQQGMAAGAALAALIGIGDGTSQQQKTETMLYNGMAGEDEGFIIDTFKNHVNDFSNLKLNELNGSISGSTENAGEFVQTYNELKELQSLLIQSAETEEQKAALRDSETFKNIQSYLDDNKQIYEEIKTTLDEEKDFAAEYSARIALSNNDALLDGIDTLEEFKLLQDETLKGLSGYEDAEQMANDYFKTVANYLPYMQKLQALQSFSEETGIDFDTLYKKYSKLTEAEQQVFLSLNTAIIKDETDLENALLERSAEVAQVRINSVLTQIQAAKEKLKSNMSDEDYEEFFATSGIDWGNNGNVSQLEFRSMSNEEQSNYINNLEQDYAKQNIQAYTAQIEEQNSVLDDYKEKVEEAQKAISAWEEESARARSYGMGPLSDPRGAIDQLNTYNALIEEQNNKIESSIAAREELWTTQALQSKSILDLEENYQGLIDNVELYGEVLSIVAEKDIASATTLHELEAAINNANMSGAEISPEVISNSLITMAEQYSHTSLEVQNYKEALDNVAGSLITIGEGENAITYTREQYIQVTERALRATIQIGEAAKQYGIDAADAEMQAKQLAEAYGYDEESAARLAIANRRLNKGVQTLNKNFDDWKDTLYQSDHTTMDYADTLNDARDALSDIVGAVNADAISFDFLNSNTEEGREHLALLEQAAKGSEIAINLLGLAVAEDTVQAIDLNDAIVSLEDGLYKIPLAGEEVFSFASEDFEYWKSTVLSGISQLEQAVANGAIQAGDSVSMMNASWVDSLNSMAVATGMSVEEMNSLLNQLGVQAKVDVINVPKKISVPTTLEYTTIKGYNTFEYEDFNGVTRTGHRPILETASVPGEVKEYDGYEQVAQISTVDNPLDPQITYTGTSGSGNTSRGGGGGISPSSTKSSNSNSSSSKKETKEKKNPTDEKERYHIINSQIEQQTTQLDRLSRAKDRAFGAQRQKEYQKELQNLKNLGKMYEEHLRQSTDYLATDKAALMQWGAIISDKDGSVLNYDALVQAQFDAYNEAVEKYNNSAQTDADKEALKAAEDAFKQFQDDLKQYEDTLGQYNEDIDNYVDNMIQQYDTMREKTSDAIEFKLQYDDDVLDFIDRLIDRLDDWNDSIFNAIDKIGKLNDKMGALFDKEATLQTGVNETLQHFLMDYKEYDEFGNVSYSTGLSGPQAQAFIDRFNSGNLDSTDLEMLSHMPEDEYNALRDYIQQQQDLEDQMRETANQVVESVQDQWDKAKDELAEAAKPIASAAEALDNYTQIIDIVGADYLGITSELAEYLDQATIDVAHEATAAAKATMESLAAQRDEIQKLYDNAIADGDGEMAEKYRKQLQGINDDVQSATEEFHQKWQEELRSIREAFEETVDRVKDDMLDAFAGPNNTWREFKDSFDYAKEAADRFVPEYKEIYELSKLNRDINKSIDDTDNVKNKEALRNLQKEINKLEEKSGELSQYDLDNARRKYELELARLALEEASTMKDTVRLSKDSEGNWSYIYTADQEDVAAAEQNYEDKLYAMQEANANYIDDLQDQMVQAEEAYADKVAEIMKDNTISEEQRQALLLAARQQFDETMDYYSGQLQTTMDNNKDLYDKDWTWYANYTANKAEMEAESGENFKQNLGYRLGDLENYVTDFNNTALGALTGFNTLDGYNQNIATSTDNGEKSMSAAWERWDQNTKRAMEGAGTSVEGFADDMKNDIDNTIIPKAKEAADAVEQMGLDMAEYMKGVVNAADEWRKQWNDKLQEIINKNDAASASMLALSKMASQLNTDVIGASTAIEKEMEKAVNSVGAAAGQMASALAAAKAAQADLNNTNNWGSGDGDANKQIPSGNPDKKVSGGCFAAGTKIKLNDGSEKSIEEIHLGEKVLSYNEDDNSFEEKEVKWIYFRQGYNQLVHLVLTNNIELTMTLGHPIYTKDGWKSFDPESSFREHDIETTLLNINDIIVGYNKDLNIIGFDIIEVPQDYIVYCLGVEDNHTFIAENVIVHNAAVSAKMSLTKFASGGYTGNFDYPSEGKLAILHEKELVLNQNDTANILSAVDMVRGFSQAIEQYANSSQFSIGNLSAAFSVNKEKDTLEQTVHITAEFPNAQDRNEIEAAFETLINQASQYANRKNI